MPSYLLPLLWEIEERKPGRPVTVFICEGVWDTLSLIQSGFNAIGIAGATNWKPYADYYKRLQDENICNFVVVFDNDEAGIDNGNKLASYLNCTMLDWKKLTDNLIENKFFLTEKDIQSWNENIKDINGSGGGKPRYAHF